MEPTTADTGTTPTPRRRTRLSLRASITQGAVALVALGGGLALSHLGHPRPRTQTVVASLSKPVPLSPMAIALARRDSAIHLAERYQRAGFPVTPVLATTIAEAASRHGISIEVAFGLVRTESEFSNRATSPVGAIGLAQLMPKTARWLKPGTTRKDLRDPATNADLGFRYLRTLVDRYEGDVELALLAYNRGPGTVDRILARGGDPDNGYARKVLGRGA